MARRTFRRRRPRVVWLPTFGSIGGFNNEAGSHPVAGTDGTLNISKTEDITWDAFPITFDVGFDPEDETQAGSLTGQSKSLQDLVSGNEYRLRRIVGKFFCAALADETDSPAALQAIADVAAGFMVVKCYDNGTPITDFDAVNPLRQASMEDPWIWRRRWLLNPYGNSLDVGFGLATDTRDSWGFMLYPQTTTGYGSVMDGPHIDQKTARVIHRHERLFFVIAGRYYSNFLNSAVADLQLNYTLDVRLLASLRPQSSGNRRNASR